MIIHVDADSMLYHAAAAAEDRYWVDKKHPNEQFKYKKELMETYPDADPFLMIDPKEEWEAIDALETLINRVIDDWPGYAFEWFLSDDKCFRHDLYPEYKSNRKGPKPTHFHACRQFMINTMDAQIVKNAEADDIVAIKGEIISSIDKDLDTVPGLHYNWHTGMLYNVTPEQARYNFWFQVLAGDSVDFIKGLPGIGEKKAPDILKDGDWANVVRNAYIEKFGEEDGLKQFELNCRLIWMSMREINDWSLENVESRGT